MPHITPVCLTLANDSNDLQAVEGAHRRVIAVLLKCGANAGARDKAGKAALHLAVKHPNSKERNRLAEAVLLVSLFPCIAHVHIHRRQYTSIDSATDRSGNILSHCRLQAATQA